MNHLNQQGLSLTEMMVAIALGTMLTAILLNLFLQQKHHYRFQTALTRLQENSRFAKYLLDQDIRQAGYQGCLNIHETQPQQLIKNPDALTQFNAATIVQGYSSQSNTQWAPSLPVMLQDQVQPNSDVLLIRKASNPVSQPLGLGPDQKTLQIQPTSHLQSGDIAIIADCEVADFFIAQLTTGQSPNQSHQLTINPIANHTDQFSKYYQTDANIMRYQQFFYYLKNSGQVNSTGQPIVSLYRQDQTGSTLELLAGVERLHISYGLDTNQDQSANTYLTAAEIQAQDSWADVVSIRLEWVMYTIDEISKTPQPFMVQGENINLSNDKRIRLAMTHIIHIRSQYL